MKLPIIGIDVRLATEERTGDAVVCRSLTRSLLKVGRGVFGFRLYTHLEADQAHVLRSMLECQDRPDVEIIALPQGRNRFWWNCWVLPWELNRRPITFYHTQYIAPLWLPTETQLMTHVHDVSFAAHPQWIAWSDRVFLSLLIPRSLRRSSRILVPSRFTCDELERYYPFTRGRVVVIPNAVAPEWLTSVTPERIQAVRMAYQLPERYIVATGTMQPRKNIPFLIQAWQERPAELRDVGLVLTGNRLGHHVDTRLAPIKQGSDIVFPGYLDTPTLQALVAGAAVAAFPSLYEGFGIPLLEAWAVSVPVWASRIPPFEAIAGDAYQSFDPLDLAEAQKTLYSLLVDTSKRERLVQRGRSRLAFFDWDKSASELLVVYQKQLSPSR